MIKYVSHDLIVLDIFIWFLAYVVYVTLLNISNYFG